MTPPKLLMIAPAPARRDGDQITLDGKFARGMAFQAHCFPGQFDCILRESEKAAPFYTETYDAERHGFGLTVLPQDGVVTEEHLSGYDLIFCSVDDDRNLGIPAKARAVGAKLATTLEYTLATRLAINAVDVGAGGLRRAYRAWKLRRTERHRQAFLAEMDGLQANGYPALEVCRRHDPETLFFLDSRMTPDMLATADEQAQRAARLQAGAPLELVFSGRLEAMKGADHLVPIAARLRDKGVPFRMRLYGAGGLEASIAADIQSRNLDGAVVLCGAVDYETELVPVYRQTADVFLSCHVQDDPSCSFIEAMGCGLAVAGYDNLMWRGLQADSQAGWVTPLRQVDAMADQLAALHEARASIVAASEAALDFARQHDFETMSQRRMTHLAALIGK